MHRSGHRYGHSKQERIARVSFDPLDQMMRQGGSSWCPMLASGGVCDGGKNARAVGRSARMTVSGTNSWRGAIDSKRSGWSLLVARR